MEIKINIELKGEDREDFIYFEMKGCYFTIMSDKHYNSPEDKTRGKVVLMVMNAEGDGNWDWSEVEDLSDLTIGEFNVLNSLIARLYKRKIVVNETTFDNRGITLTYV
jgi:hypothetical protein